MINTLPYAAACRGLALCALLFAGCVSTQERFDKAGALEARGDYAGAADHYLRVLEKEPSFEQARTRLAVAGGLAVDDHLGAARTAEQAGRYEDALAALDRLDALHARADAAGVTLALPDDYEGYRRALTGQAHDALVARGDAAERERRWSDAVEHYARARERYAATPGQRAELDARAARAFLRWGEQDLGRGYPRAAHARAAEVLALLPPDATAAAAARRLQDEALAAGTHRVAFLPLWQTDAARRAAPEVLLEEVNDLLSYEHWAAPPLFVAAINPAETRRTLRRMELDRHVLAPAHAADVGRALRADLVVAGELTHVETEDARMKEERRRALLRGRRSTATGEAEDTSYVVQRFTRTVEATVAYRVVDPATRRTLAEGTVTAGADAPMRRAVYAGDYTDLDVDGSTLDLFDPERQRREEEALAEALAERLTAEVARRVHADLLRQIR